MVPEMMARREGGLSSGFATAGCSKQEESGPHPEEPEYRRANTAGEKAVPSNEVAGLMSAETKE